MTPSCPPTWHSAGLIKPLLHSYFKSGWAFFIPYLTAYALYGWIDGPINPVSLAEASGVSLNTTNARALTHGIRLPSLLHVYWVLHISHLLLLAILISSWARGGTSPRPNLSFLLKLAPWICIIFIFWLPGTYLEFPADPWSHYYRINEWHLAEHAEDHSAWTKASYILAYSLFGFLRDTGWELIALDYFQAAICTLLAWQHYRLARISGLRAAPSLIFSITSIFILGNNIFGFYRYYGISSSVLAQIAFLASTRHLIILANQWARVPLHGVSDRPIHTVTAAVFSGLLAVMNHPQALAFIALAGGAIGACTLVSRFGKVSVAWMIALLLGASVSASFSLATGDSKPWTNDWGGFSLLPGTPAGARAIEILGAVGIINLVAGLALILRNQVVGWLTVVPTFALVLPASALPLTHALHAASTVEMFNRMLLATPAPLAIIWLIAEWLRSPSAQAGKERYTGAFSNAPQYFAYTFTLLVVLYLTTAPASNPIFNRLFNAFERSNIGTGWQSFPPDVSSFLLKQPENQGLFGPPNVRFVSDASGLTYLHHSTREVLYSLRISETAHSVETVHNFTPKPILLLVKPTTMTAPVSLAGHLSGHWPAQAMHFESAGHLELSRIAKAERGTQIGRGAVELYLFSIPFTPDRESLNNSSTQALPMQGGGAAP